MGEDLKVKGEKLLIYDDLPIFGTGSLPVRSRSKYLLTYPITYRSKYLFRPEWKQIPEVFLILRKHLLILGKSKYVWAALLQWDKYLNVNNRSGINARKGWFCIPFWERKISKKKDSCEFKPSL